MNFKPQTNVDLAELTTMRIGGKAKYFTEVSDPAQIPDIFTWLKAKDLPHIILSGGSNTVFDDGTFNGLVIKIDIKGFQIIREDDDSTVIKAGSGENWDETVRRCVDKGLAGIEALSGIPGNCGAAPVQNIGAYGQEIKDTLESVEVFDTSSNTVTSLSKSECQLSYRNSIFKSSQKGRYIITAISLKLSKKPPEIPQYKDIIEYFADKKVISPSVSEIRRAVIEIRSTKFADPNKVPNSGSFFKNPIVNAEQAKALQARFPDIKAFETEDGQYKLFAGWLIEQAGLKGKQLDHVQVDPNHALVLENTGKATQNELMALITEVQAEVKNKFGIQLEPEPVIVKF